MLLRLLITNGRHLSLSGTHGKPDLQRDGVRILGQRQIVQDRETWKSCARSMDHISVT